MFLIILIFIAFSIATFLINNVWVLLGLTTSNILLHFIFKISPVKALKNLLKILMFVLIIFLFNLIFDSVVASLIVAWKIIIVANGAFIFSYKINATKLAQGFNQLFYPLKLFKVNTNNLSLMIVIAINFIPILTNEAYNLKLTLKARNVNLNLKTLFTQSHKLFVMFFANIFKRVDELELVLRARNYNAE
ncbi:MAG: energy-coupling factor transporter transmembrane protein EcfT [Firmicutes bacterium]|nr:energy-coupling factor transporter transmembrane protein EcfT [Bacillota bacterium]MDY5042228.1 energy-coupling factor transporter transmembrane component T [Eubacteriales bacterium]